jgi:hypothetical protein
VPPLVAARGSTTTQLPFPSWLHTGWEFYKEKLSADAEAHHALCNVAISTPGTSPPYLYNISWYIFPSHVLAVGDLEAFNVHTLFSRVTIDKRAVGFPTPNYELAATDTSSGKSVIEVTFADGPTVASGYVYGGGTLAQAIGLAHLAASELQHLHAAG